MAFYRFLAIAHIYPVQEFASPTLLTRSAGMLQPLAPSLSAVTPRTPKFTSMQPVLNLLPEKLSNWAETVAMMTSSPFTPSPEMNGALVALGDQLMANNWTEAAHVWWVFHTCLSVCVPYLWSVTSCHPTYFRLNHQLSTVLVLPELVSRCLVQVTRAMFSGTQIH